MSDSAHYRSFSDSRGAVAGSSDAPTLPLDEGFPPDYAQATTHLGGS